MIEYNVDDDDDNDDNNDDNYDDDKTINKTNKYIELFCHRRSKRNKENGDRITRRIF